MSDAIGLLFELIAFRHTNGVGREAPGGGVVTEACSVRGIARTGNANDPAEETLLNRSRIASLLPSSQATRRCRRRRRRLENTSLASPPSLEN